MRDYKKRLRLFAARHGAVVEYTHNDGLALRTDGGVLGFMPDSKSGMVCTVATLDAKFTFRSPQDFVFDVAHCFFSGKALDEYRPKGPPLGMKEYIEEESHAGAAIKELKELIEEGIAQNAELGGNHYNAEYFNGILILSDRFTCAPTNVMEFV